MTPYEEYVLELMHDRGFDEPLEPEPERLPARKAPKRMTSADRANAARLRASGKTLRGIARELGYSAETIRTHLRRLECAGT